MIPSGVEIFVGLEPIDLRWGFDRLAGVVEERITRKPRGGALFVFFGKRRDALKVLFHDGTGFCLFYKRLDRGTFRLPEAPEAGAVCIVIEERALDDLLEGIDGDDLQEPRRSDRGQRDRIYVRKSTGVPVRAAYGSCRPPPPPRGLPTSGASKIGVARWVLSPSGALARDASRPVLARRRADV